jgi:histone H1/5
LDLRCWKTTLERNSMSNLVTALREELARIIRAELKAALSGLATPSTAPRAPKGRRPKAATAVAADAPAVQTTAKEIKALRNRLGVTGPEFARLCGVSSGSVYNWCNSSGILKLSAAAGQALLRVQGLSPEAARTELGPPPRRGRKARTAGKASGQSAPGKPARPAKGKPGRQAKVAAAAEGGTLTVPGSELKALRQRLGTTIAEFGRLTGVSTSSVYNWEHSQKPIRLRRKTAAVLAGLRELSPEAAREMLGPPPRRGRKPKAQNATAPKRRGRKPKAAPTDTSAAPKRRGRPRKVSAPTEAAAPKRRGRPRKAAPADAAPAAPKRRGRPRKADATAPKRRGRKPKAAPADASAAPKRRGRPRQNPLPAEPTAAEAPAPDSGAS